MSHEHADVPLRVLGWCAALQALGAVVDFIGGYLTHSFTVTSDGWHMTADVLPAATTLIIRAMIQSQRRNGNGKHFAAAISGSGYFNILTLVIGGIIAIAEASPAVVLVGRNVNSWMALAVAVVGLSANWGGHALVHRHAAGVCEHDSKADITSLSAHLYVDTIASAAAILFLILNLLYRVSWWDTAGGIVLGVWMIGYAVVLSIKPMWRRHRSLHSE